MRSVLEVADGILEEELSVAALLSVARPGLEDIAHESIVNEGSVSLLACLRRGEEVCASGCDHGNDYHG